MRAIALILSVTALATASTTGGASTGSSATRCGKWAVPARIGGKAVCLRDNGRCSNRRAAQYRRYGFDCSLGTLLTRWDFLQRRQLTDLRVAPGDPCPVTTDAGHVGSHPGLGPGPAYPLGTHNAITLTMPPPETWGPEWSGTKRVWLLDTRYAARALVRGRQLDGPNEVRFVRGPQWTAAKLLNPVRSLQVEGPTPSLTRLREPGCYTYQVDGRAFSYLIVFEARLAPRS